jgi:hypothetical protein
MVKRWRLPDEDIVKDHVLRIYTWSVYICCCFLQIIYKLSTWFFFQMRKYSAVECWCISVNGHTHWHSDVQYLSRARILFIYFVQVMLVDSVEAGVQCVCTWNAWTGAGATLWFACDRASFFFNFLLACMRPGHRESIENYTTTIASMNVWYSTTNTWTELRTRPIVVICVHAVTVSLRHTEYYYITLTTLLHSTL